MPTFNLEGLGAICRRYVADAYGPSTSSLHGRLPTDRLVAEWHLASHRVRSRVRERRARGGEAALGDIHGLASSVRHR